MALTELTLDGTPLDITAMMGQTGRSSAYARAQNRSQTTVYRVVAASPPTDLSGAAFAYGPSETFSFIVYGPDLGNTYLLTSGPLARVIFEDNAP